MQAKLLRFLQSFNFERVGGNQRLHADVRIIAASNRDLRQAVSQGIFRQDLFYRLHVVHLHLPPLRQRPHDLPLLAEEFLKRFAAKYGRKVQQFSPRAYRQIMAHSWPGNVRELENAVERAVILCRGQRIEHLDLDPSAWQEQVGEEASFPPTAEDAGDVTEQPLAQYMAQCERSYLEALLKKHQGSIQDTARAAGINPKTLYLKMGRYGLSKMDYRPRRRRRQAGRTAVGPGGGEGVTA